MNVSLQKTLAIWRNRLYLYPAPDPMPRNRSFWAAIAIVALAAAAFSVYFILYMVGQHNAYNTSAEDLGIMDQAIWNTLHGHLLHQTICDSVSDTNCYGLNGVIRFAIHFEPILLPISLLYLLVPGPQTLLVLQTLVVASGAFPAYLLARLRLRNQWAGIVLALLYLLYPVQQQATVYDFHAVTLTAALLLFTLYFMYTRRTVWVFVFAILSMACKEEIALVIILLGLWSMVFQQRWRSGIALVVLGGIWIGAELYLMHFFSPTGKPLLESRYAALGSNPLQMLITVLTHPVSILRNNVFEHQHELYLRILLSPAGYLPLLAPWALVLAVPTIGLNLLSSDPNMHSGYYQYNAEIVPILIFSTIEAMVLILWLAQWYIHSLQTGQASQTRVAAIRRGGNVLHFTLLVLMLGLLMFSVLRDDTYHGVMPYSVAKFDGFQGIGPVPQTFQWPQSNAHTTLAQQFIDMIPQSASVSAQSHLAPHISERQHIYLFPGDDTSADYIFLDVTGNTFPLLADQYISAVKSVLLGGHYGIVAARDGYLLLKHGLPPPDISPNSPYSNSSDTAMLLPNLPPAFCSFTHVAEQQVPNTGEAAFSSSDGSTSLTLSGLHITNMNPQMYSLGGGTIQVFADWKVTAPTAVPLQLGIFLTDQNGKQYNLTSTFPALAWCPTNIGQPGTIESIQSSIIWLNQIQQFPYGLAHLSLVVLPATQPFDIMSEQAWYDARIIQGNGTLAAGNGGKALQLATIRITP